MKNLSFKQRIVYLWDYYRYHALIVIFCIVFFCYFLSPLLATKKHDLLSIAIIDSTQTAKEDCSALSDDLTSLLGGNTKYDAVHIDTSGTTYDTSSSSTIKLYEKYNSKGAFSNACDISNCSQWVSYGYTDYSGVYACIPVSCKHPKQAAKVIDYLNAK